MYIVYFVKVFNFYQFDILKISFYFGMILYF